MARGRKHANVRAVDGRLRAPVIERAEPPALPRQTVRNLVAQARAEGVQMPPEGLRLPPNGSCYDCGRLVSGERRFCGPCLTGHTR